jgi:hypothetical protein
VELREPSVPWASCVPDALRVDKSEPAVAAPDERRQTGRQAEARCRKQFGHLLGLVTAAARSETPRKALGFERELLGELLELGKLLMVLWLVRTDEALAGRLGRRPLWRGGRLFETCGGAQRTLGTVFGKIGYWRRYRYCRETDRGYYPVDEVVGLSPDGFTPLVVSQSCRLATRMSFAAAGAVFSWFLRWAPSTRSIEELALGLGAHAHRFQEQVPAPADDGEVLVIQVDSKGIPTATAQELGKRRQPRSRAATTLSRRHRGRELRQARGPRPRRAKDDKSKNARMATLVVMYTLRQDPTSATPRLIGPLNPRVHASFLPKRYAFQLARREAVKRGFTPGSGKRIQFVYDGDDDLETYRKQYFADYPAESLVCTADIAHVMEYLWDAAAVLHPEGPACTAWVATQRERLLASRASLIRRELREALGATPRTGPGTKARREQLKRTLRYLKSNAERLDYKLVRALDLELASGMVEGAVRNVIGLRFDHGGMRWILERAEALLQLRCIEVNGLWDDFIAHVYQRLDHADPSRRPRLRRRQPPPMPVLLKPHVAVTHYADNSLES